MYDPEEGCLTYEILDELVESEEDEEEWEDEELFEEDEELDWEDDEDLFDEDFEEDEN